MPVPPARKAASRHSSRCSGDVRLDALDDDLLQRRGGPGDGEVAGLAVRNELADHRVVVGRDLVAGVDVAVEPDAGSARWMEERDRAGRGAERRRMLGVDAALDGMSLDAYGFLRERQLLAGRDPELGLDDVDAGDELRHRMLHLQPRVHSR